MKNDLENNKNQLSQNYPSTTKYAGGGAAIGAVIGAITLGPLGAMIGGALGGGIGGKIGAEEDQGRNRS